ncbi:MAG: Peptide deformylase [Alphaproteobacteria bacterium MarineAlpha5_Bin11]|nr:peptide deformylase [Pelagibacteraceae bacterium]PPR44309.1 MAG: Peptide deformylase [Alphaproteobacteria bacterium MarineAlpha5_Bin11]PPR52021.1 MAG: Peptide deformylase [Alphaproteobacteria bacterium MarineAlpha5_Bin10]|tara:strand:- start:3305 stop:3844 length:540 start_codon:yes stop_codon:yes gene_type:complete
MSILKIAKIGHPVLFAKASPVVKISKNDLKNLILNMAETLLDADGLGLAAPQVHLSKRVIIFRSFEDNNQINDEGQKIISLINPSYKKISEDYEDDWEGCLSIPGMLGKVRRYKKITYKGYDLNGKIIKKDADGLEARVIQHECDHLDGILFTSKLTSPEDFGFADEIKKNVIKENESK